MKQALKQKVLMIGALEADRQMKRKLEASNYSIIQNFEYFRSLLSKSHKHYSDIEQLKRFLQHIPYLKQITEGMSMRLVEKIIHQLSLRFLNIGSQSGTQFQILLSGEIQVGQRSFVQTDTLNESGTVLRDAWILELSQEGYNDLIRDYHENLLAQKLQLIQQYSVFAKISIQRLKNQLDQFKHESATNNTVLYNDKQPVESVYLVISGEVKLLQDGIELQLVGPKSVFGEMELILESDVRLHKAVVTQHLWYYRIGYHQLRILLNSSCMYEAFAQNYQLKAQFWNERKQQCKKTVEVPVDFSEFKHSIPKTYHNYIKASKLLKYQNAKSNLDHELREAKEDKLNEAYKQFNYQIRQDFKHNHLLRKVLIQARQTNHDLPIMKGLQLERYLPRRSFTHKRSMQVLSQFNETSYQRFISDVETGSTATFVKGTRLLSAASRLQSGVQKFYTSAAKMSRPQTVCK